MLQEQSRLIFFFKEEQEKKKRGKKEIRLMSRLDIKVILHRASIKGTVTEAL